MYSFVTKKAKTNVYYEVVKKEKGQTISGDMDLRKGLWYYQPPSKGEI